MDGREREKYVGEVGSMNMFFVLDGKVVTPWLDGTILPGITRDSAIKVLKHAGYTVEERAVSIDELERIIRKGNLTRRSARVRRLLFLPSAQSATRTT